MSATDYYQPHVWIDGVQLAEHRGIAGITPVADLSIKWGASDWWQTFDASRLTVTLLDPFGELLSIRRGAEIVVTVDPDGRTLFRGTMDASTAKFRERTTPQGVRVPVWEVRIEAFDPLAKLAADRQHGPTYAGRNAQQNTLHWGRQRILERFESLTQRSPVPIAYTYSTWWQSTDQHLIDSPNSYVYPCAPYTTQQNISVLQVLRRSARILHPLNRPYFDHEENTIRLLRPQVDQWATMSARVDLGDTHPIDIARTGGDVLTVNGADLEPASGALSLHLKPQDHLKFANLVQRREELVTPQSGSGFWGTHYDVVDAYGSTVTISGDASASVELETDLSAGWAWPDDALGSLGTLMRATHQWREIPKIRYRVGKTETSHTALHDALFRAQPKVSSAYPERLLGFALVNTQLQWAASLPYFSVVGGELRYTAKSGWVVDANPATIATNPSTGTRLTDAGSHWTGDVYINAADPSLTVADFQLI